MTNQYMQEEDDAILKTYNRYPVVLDHGDGAYLYDPEGKKYLDFSAGYAVSSLGYNNKEFNDALKAQIDKMIHTSNLYYNTTCGKAGEDLKRSPVCTRYSSQTVVEKQSKVRSKLQENMRTQKKPDVMNLLQWRIHSTAEVWVQ